jgi:uncharacterized protein YjdB
MQLKVVQNGKATNIYSQFSRCNNHPFETWYKDLPVYCYAEANDNYSVSFCGSEICAEILKETFSADSHCIGFRFENEYITTKHRAKWADEISLAIGANPAALALSIGSGTDMSSYQNSNSPICKQGSIFAFSDYTSLPIRIYNNRSISVSNNATISSSRSDYDTLVRSGTASKPALFILLGGADPKFIEEQGNIFLFSCGSSSLISFLSDWLHDFAILPYIKSIYPSLSAIQRKNLPSDSTLLIKYNLLKKTEPYLKLTVSSPIEINSTGNYKLVKLPEDMPCKLELDRSDIVCFESGGILKPLKEGNVRLKVYVARNPSISVTEQTTVYKRVLVQSVSITGNTKDIIVGDSICLATSFHPSRAHNISSACWSISPAGSLDIVSDGHYVAKKPGNVTVTVKVGTVSQSISFTISSKPTDIYFDKKNISLKLGQRQTLKTTILPSDCLGGTVSYRISDASVISFDPNSGQITSLAEGDAVISATLINNNKIVSTCQCRVVVLPPKAIITPDGPFLMMLISLIGSILFFSKPFQFVFGFLAIGGAVWHIIDKKSTRAILISIICILVVVGLLIYGGLSNAG